jgi:hypothetical protein
MSRRLVLCLLILVCSSAVHALSDALTWQWRESHDLPVHWDNVEASSLQWVAGIKPVYDGNVSMHVVELRAGEYSQVAIPAGQWLRMLSLDGKFGVDKVQVRRSIDGRLYSPERVRISEDGHSLVTADLHAEYGWLRIQAAQAWEQPLRLALFVSRSPAVGEVAAYPRVLDIETGAVPVRFSERPGQQRYWSLQAGRDATLRVQGPQRIRLLSRLVLEEHSRNPDQAYRVEARLGDGQVQVLELETADERRDSVEINGCIEALGRTEQAFIDVPAGNHRLTLSTSRHLYLQLAGGGSHDGYFIASNATGISRNEPDDVATPSIWALLTTSLQRLFSRSTPVPESERLAQRLARDNQWRAANLSAAQGLAGPRDYSPGQLARFKPAARRASSLQHYVNLLPDKGSSVYRQRSMKFSRFTLAVRQEPALLWQKQLPALANTISRGHFTETPVAQAQALRFRLPARHNDSQLRLIVNALQNNEEGVLYVRFDDGPVQTVVLAQQRQPAQPAVYRPEPALLAAALLRQKEQAPLHNRASPSWGTLHLPAGVRSVRLWAAQPGAWTALQLQDSVNYQPREGAYLAAIDSVRQEQAAARFLELLQNPVVGARDAAGGSESAAQTELDNLWLPLLRYLHVQARYYPAAGEDTAQQDQPVAGRAGLAWQRRAEQAEEEGDWLLAIEHWSRALRQVQGDPRERVRLRRALALYTYGETELANRDLWHIYRDSNNDAVRGEALETLLDRFSRAGDFERGVRIVSAALLVRPDLELLQQLVPLLVESGRFNEALQVALLLPHSQQLDEPVLRAARAAGWWTVFDLWLKRLPDSQEKRFWSAWPEVASGAYTRALELWTAAGNRGKRASEQLQAALDIRAALNQADHQSRLQALLRWEQWQAGMLEQGVWRSASDAVTEHAGSATLVIPELGLNLRRYLATPTQALKLAVYGPTRLRVSLRPLYAKSQALPDDDWLTVAIDQRIQRFAVIANAPDAERHIAEHDYLQPGQRDRFVIDIPAGYHELALSPAKRQALLAIETLQPAVFGELLPALTPGMVAALPGRPPAGDPVAGTTGQWPVQLAQHCHVRSVTLSLSEDSPGTQIDSGVFEQLAGLRESLHTVETHDPVQVFTDLLWQATQEPSRLAELAALAQTQYTTLRKPSAVRPLMQRLRRDMAWKPVTNLWQRAGVRDITLSEDRAEHPSARLRQALLPPLATGQERISGRSVLVFSVEQPHPVEFSFDFKLEALLQAPTAALSVAIKVDERQEHILRLHPQRDKDSYRLSFARGAHSVRIRLLDPVARHSVRVHARERQADQSWALRALRPKVRSYHVATRDEPLVLYAQGPALLRIDEWRDDHIVYRYRRIESGWQKLSFHVASGRDEALYSVFQWVADEPEPPLPMRLPASVLHALPKAPVTAQFREPGPLSLQHQLALGGQEDGTLSGTLELASRRNLDEDRDAGADAEDFIELRGTHRKYLQHWDGYHRFDLLGRIRNDGGPTLGVGEFLNIPTDWHAVEINLKGSFYIQRPGGEAGTEWSGDIRGRVLQRRDLSPRSYHRPTLRVFRRWMSLDDDLAVEPERVDQDVFTVYKAQHKQGLGLGDDLFYRPWGDVIGWLGASVNSNEDFNLFDPDNVRGRIGARLLIRDWDIGAEYVATHYFQDEDRSSSLTRERLRLAAQMWRWSSPRNGLQLRLRFDHDRSSSDNSVWLSLIWHRSNGRLFRDFYPGDLRFRGLRERISNEYLFPRETAVQP